MDNAKTEAACQKMIKQWGYSVYEAWSIHHQVIDGIAKKFMDKVYQKQSQ